MIYSRVGCLKHKHKIIIDAKAILVVYNARKIPLSIRDQLKAELNQLEKINTIEKKSEPTDWAHSLVIVKKPNNKIRICLYPKELNKVMKREYVL